MTTIIIQNLADDNQLPLQLEFENDKLGKRLYKNISMAVFNKKVKYTLVVNGEEKEYKQQSKLNRPFKNE